MRTLLVVGYWLAVALMFALAVVPALRVRGRVLEARIAELEEELGRPVTLTERLRLAE
jgi:hypothetical protein